MSAKKTVYIISGKHPLSYYSGYASYARSLAKVLTKQGFRVLIFCVGEREEVVASPIGEVHVISSRLLRFLKNREMAGLIFLAPPLAFAIARKVGRKETSILWGIGPWGLAVALVKRFSRARTIFLADYFTTIKHEFQGTLSAMRLSDYGFRRLLQNILARFSVIFLYSLLEKFLLTTSDKIITHYKSTEAILINEMGIGRERFTRLPLVLGEADGTTSAFRTSFEKPLIVSLARHDGRKGINYLLHALGLLERRGVMYKAVIIGGGRLLEAHKMLARKLGLTQVEIMGSVANPSYFLKKADLFVLPSLEEGSSSLAILEAMREGLPIVSTNVDGIKEDLEDGVSALLVAPKDAHALADASQRLLKDRKLAEKLGKAAKAYYQKKYSFKKAKEELGAFIQAISYE